jgi:carbamoyl-phosphate synthase small subunit
MAIDTTVLQMQYFLVLEDGTLFKGQNYERQNNFPETVGEVVFNTTNSGYEEIATDPSYLNQIIVMTNPMQGNYGVDHRVWESRQFWIKGFVCLQIQNSKLDSSWADRLCEHRVPILTGVDTRKLVLKLRDSGTPWGAIIKAESQSAAREKALNLIKAQKPTETDWVYLASRKNIKDIQGQIINGPRVAVLDFGTKENILNELLKKASVLRIFPSRTSGKEIAEWKPDSLMLTNGPGDPAAVEFAVETVKGFLGKIPIFGICMGHQILSLALGAKTYKLKFGHRGANHPIKDLLLNLVYMSSQNHGYAVDDKTLPAHSIVTHRNLNDHSVAGFFSEEANCLGIQFHPEASPGPHEATQLFDYFFSKMHKKKERMNNDFNFTI